MTTVASISFAFLTISIWINCSCGKKDSAHKKRYYSGFTVAPIDNKQVNIFPWNELTVKLVDEKVVHLIDDKNKKKAVIDVDDNMIAVAFDKGKTTLLYEPEDGIKVIYGNSTPYITVDEDWENDQLVLRAAVIDLRIAPPDYNNNRPIAVLTAKEANTAGKSKIKCERPYFYSKFTATAFGTSAVGWSYDVYSDTFTVGYFGELVHFNGVNHTIAGPASRYFNRINSLKKNQITWLSANRQHRIDLTSTKLQYRHNNGAVLRLRQHPHSDIVVFDSLVVVMVRVYKNGAPIGQVRWPATGYGVLAGMNYGGDWHNHCRIKNGVRKCHGNRQKSVKNTQHNRYNKIIGSKKNNSTVDGSFSVHCGVPQEFDANFLGAALWPARLQRSRHIKLWVEDSAASVDSALNEFGPSPAAYKFIYKSNRTVILQKTGTVRLLIEQAYKP